ncbi:MAG: S8 family serine peptidase [Thermoplasmata archaeon]
MKRCTKVAVIAAFLAIVVVGSVFWVMSTYKATPATEKEVVYVSANPMQIQMLEKSGIHILEKYDNYILVEVTGEEKAVLEKNRFEVANVDNAILLRNYQFDPLQGESGLQNVGSDVKIVQFIGPVKDSWKTALVNLGCEIYWYVPNNAFLVKVPSSSLSLVKKLSFVRWVGEYLPAYKVDTALSGMGEAKVSISLLEPEALGGVMSVINSYGGEVIKASSTRVIAKLSQAGIRAVAELAGVEFVSPYYEMKILNNNAQWITQTGISENRKIWDKGIHGEGQIVGESDTGIDYDHAAFRDPNVQIVQNQVNQNHRKIVLYKNFADGKDLDSSGHGTHVAGTIAGDDSYVGGTSSYDGMAYKAKLAFADIGGSGDSLSGIPSDLNDLFGPLYSAGARIISNSWGASTNTYDDDARMVDLFMWNYKDCLILFANGNSGSSGASTVGSPATAKSVVSVGASQNSPNQNNVAYFSSRGPTADGRMKPTLTAVGYSLYSADSDGNLNSNNAGYISMAGTSMATPCAAGNAALVRQYFTEGWYPTGTKNPANAITPSAALLKAVLMVGGVELTGSYSDMNNEGKFPNNSQGWGRINLDNSLYFSGDTLGLQIVDETTGITTGQYKEYQYTISSNAQPFKVILTWTDYPGTVGASKALVNNLDLKVTAPDGSVYLGNVFSGKNPGHSVTGGTADSVNAEEGVILPTPVTGTYTIRVTATSVPNGPQPFALALIGAFGSGGSDTTPPVISNVAASGITANSATITWTTDEASTSVVEYGTTTSYGQTATGSSGVTSHSVTLSGLTASTTYHFRVKSADAAGNLATSSDYTFTTSSASDTTPPVISNVAASGITANSATITWTTDEASTSVVEYGTTTSYGQTATGSSGVTSHSVTLSGLTASTTYHFRVKSADAAGNLATSSDYTFTTLANSTDVVVLTDGVAATGSLSATKDAKYYMLSVAAGKTLLKIELTGPSGTDFDLYAKLGAKPTTSTYDYRSIGSTSTETINVTNPSAGDWYFMVYSYSGSGTFTIKATTSTSSTNVTQLTDGVAATGSLSASKDGKYYSITIPSGKAQLKIEMTGPSGTDFDVYVKLGAMPTTSSYDYSGTTSSASETVSITNPAAGTWYIYVYSYSGSGTFTIKASTSTSTDTGQLTDGVAKTGSLSATGAKAYYYITIPSGKSQLKIELTGPSGTDFDLYVKLGANPSTSSYDYRSIGSTSTETITISSPAGGTWYIMIYSYSGSGSFTIKATSS